MENQDLKAEKRKERGRRITEFYENRGLKRKDFAALVNTTYDTLRAWEAGRAEAPSDFYNAVLHHFKDADIGYLITGIPSRPKNLLQEDRKIPIISEIRAGDLAPQIEDENASGFTTTENLTEPELFALKVRGSSMRPEILEGDLAICAPHRPFIPGQIYAVVVDDHEATLKRVWRRKHGWELVPANPDYESKIVGEKELRKLIRVIELRRQYD
jgi:repressor LexA